MFIVWLIICYLAGAIPWSVWMGKRLSSVDPRDQPDHNPGAANAFRAGGWRLGTAVLLLDFCKAFLPVAIARWLIRFPDNQLFWLALMPTVGHAFSVFLRFRGGRGIVTMFGVWTALTLYLAPAIMGLTAIAALFVLKNDEGRSIAIPLLLIVFLLLTGAPGWMIALACAQLAVLGAKIAVFLSRQHAQKRIGAAP